MAKIGLNNFRWATLTVDSGNSYAYDGAKIPAKAISCDVSITNNSATLYADDALAESDTSFQSGTVSLGVDDENLEMIASMLGHTYSSGQITRNKDDVAPYIGLGRVATKMVGNVRKYRAEVLYKVKMSEPSVSEATQGETLEFSTPTIEGTISTLSNGDWSTAKEFDTKDAAVSFIESIFSVSST